MSAVQVTDRGLQPERTSLSFVRTSLSIFGLVVACLRWLPPSGSVALIGSATAGLLVAGGTIYERRSRSARMLRFGVEQASPATGVGALLAVSVVLLSFSGLWVLVH
ncbi:DUF202 domain-containing protein [Rhodococcus wratislaviensis]|uniref:DUF202 domain-containing protein n=1 Tax=Rhodococcus wratislaviensis TaxID=44752 RepID=UPI003518AE22